MSAARRQMIADINVMDRSEKVSELIEKLETVIAHAIENGAGSNAIGAMRLQTELLQLNNKHRAI